MHVIPPANLHGVTDNDCLVSKYMRLEHHSMLFMPAGIQQRQQRLLAASK